MYPVNNLCGLALQLLILSPFCTEKPENKGLPGLLSAARALQEIQKLLGAKHIWDPDLSRDLRDAMVALVCEQNADGLGAR